MDRRLLQTVADTCQQHTCRPLILPLLQKETKAAAQMVWLFESSCWIPVSIWYPAIRSTVFSDPILLQKRDTYWVLTVLTIAETHLKSFLGAPLKLLPQREVILNKPFL